MLLRFADLICPECRAYAHPFLDRCPGCGAPRSSRFEEALADRVDDPSLADDPALQRHAAEAATKYTLAARRSGVMGTMGAEGVVGQAGVASPGSGGTPPSGPPLDELADQVASQLTYRGEGFDRPGRHDVDLRIGAESLTFIDRRREQVGNASAAHVLAAVPVEAGTDLPELAGIGDAFGRPAAPPTLEGHRVAIAWATPTGVRQVVLGNRPGFMSARARLGHYVDLARWLGATAAAQAQHRWRSIGAAPYAVELGLRTAPTAPVVSATGFADTPSSSQADARRPARERLEELESLRAAGLVTAAEYDAKRREILAGL